MRGRVGFVVVVAIAACDRHRASPESPPTQPSSTAAASHAFAAPVPVDPLEGDPREAARTAFGFPPRPGRVVFSVAAVTNADPQVNAAGVLAATGAQGKVVTVWSASDGLHVGGPIDLGNARFVASDGANVCAAEKHAFRCARVDGAHVAKHATADETTGMWGGPGVLLRATMHGLETGLEASDDGFATVRAVGVPKRRAVVAAWIDGRERWTTVLLPLEGTPKPRFGLTIDGGKGPVADFGALDRTGWSGGDRLWPDQLVTGAFATETVYAERGEKQSRIELPWAAAGGFAFGKRALLLFGRGPTGHGGFLLVELPSKRVTSFVPPGLAPVVAAGRVGAAIVAITSEGKVLAWE